MNNVAAAIGLSQMPHIERILAAHRRNAAIYDEAFGNSLPFARLRCRMRPFQVTGSIRR